MKLDNFSNITLVKWGLNWGENLLIFKNLFGEFPFQKLPFLLQHQLVVEVQVLFVPVHPIRIDCRTSVFALFFHRKRPVLRTRTRSGVNRWTCCCVCSLWRADQRMGGRLLALRAVRTVTGLGPVSASAAWITTCSSFYWKKCFKF